MCVSSTKKYLEMFFEEKDLDGVCWELTASNGVEHLISNDVVVEHIMIAPEQEQLQIAGILRQIDFRNGDVNHFLRHLAQGLVNNY